MNEQITGTALALPEPTALATMFHTPDGIEGLLAYIETEARSHAPDLSTAKGRDAIKSLAFKVVKSKTALDDVGKSVNEDARAQINAVDAKRRLVRERLDALRDEVRKPLDDWQAAEESRVQKLTERLDRVRLAHTMLPENPTAEQIAALLTRVMGIEIDDSWQERKADAQRYKDQAVLTLQMMAKDARDREAQEIERQRLAAELEQLRAEKAARDEADRIRAEAQAVEAARVEAEKIEAERQRITAERAEADRIAAEKAEADRQAQFEREKLAAAQKAEQDAIARAKVEAERAAFVAAEREAALRKDKADAEARHAREMADAKARAEAVAQAERDKLAAERKAEADARARREADTAHRAKIIADIADALRKMAGNATPELIAEALIEGRIPHTRVAL